MFEGKFITLAEAAMCLEVIQEQEIGLSILSLVQGWGILLKHANIGLCICMTQEVWPLNSCVATLFVGNPWLLEHHIQFTY